MSENPFITVDNDLNIVKVIYEGELNSSTTNRLVYEARSRAHELGYNLLYDLRLATIKGSFSEMYFFAREHESLKMEEAKKIKSANIIPGNNKLKEWQFFETTANNAGLSWRAFKTEAEAVAWLTED